MNPVIHSKAWTERFTQKFGLSIQFGSLLMVILFYVPVIVLIGWLTNYFIWSNLLWYAWIAFFMFVFLCVNNYPRIFRSNVRQLSKRFSLDEQRREAFIKELEEFAFGKKMSYFSLIFTPLFFVLFLCFVVTGSYVPIMNLWIDLYGAAFIVTFYIPAFWMAIASVIAVNRFSNQQKLVTIDILDPERCGGLKPVGSLLLTGATLWSVGLAWCIAMTMLKFSPIVLVILCGSIATSAFWFVFPQSKIHSFMSSVKKEEMQKFSKPFSENTQALFQSSITRDEQMFLMERSSYSLRVFERIEKMNTWPLDTGMLFQFVSAVMLPLATYVLKMIVPT